MDRRTFTKSLLFSSFSFIMPCISSASQPSNSDLERLIHREYRETDNLARRDNQYLLDNLDDKSKKAIIDHEETIERIHRFLNGLNHINYESIRKKEFPEDVIYNGNFDIYRVNMRQLARIYLLCENLKTEKFRNRIGQEIVLDLADLQTNNGFLPSERGGLINSEGKNLFLMPQESLESKQKFNPLRARFSNRRYFMDPSAANEISNLFKYHLHAVEQDCTHLSGPSFDVLIEGGRKIGDLNAARERIKKAGESHNLVITKLKGTSFNICYFGGEIMSNGKSPLLILSLGNWHYQ